MAPATTTTTQYQARPPPSGPRIPLDIIDGPQQRLYLVSLFLLLSGIKLHSFLVPQSPPPIWTLLAPKSLNTTSDYELARWVLLDVGFVGLVGWLRVPRLAWGPVAGVVIGAGLVGLDFGLFGRWEVSNR